MRYIPAEADEGETLDTDDEGDKEDDEEEDEAA